uniref:Uncharacterized protein MANES_07G136700 n=1 Tax=Rhizophora mucronata TaxID=61149 RepID=A0A2P2IQG6_RHIMU
MGKSAAATGKLQELAKIVSSHKPKRTKTALPSILPLRPREVRAADSSERAKLKKMEESSSSLSISLDGQKRVPLSHVVSDCVRRWFQDTLREAKAGDVAMQVLVGQMYSTGYGIPKDPRKGCAWINRASRTRPSAWKVSNKLPGYNASDSDSDETKGDTM